MKKKQKYICATNSYHEYDISHIFNIWPSALSNCFLCFFSVKKVCVGGSKPGRIEFLGETKFAPGEWAGVVLDEPVGKNDGSVGGVSYFKVSRNPKVFRNIVRNDLISFEISTLFPQMVYPLEQLLHFIFQFIS